MRAVPILTCLFLCSCSATEPTVTNLHAAIKESRYERVQRILAAEPSLADSWNAVGITALHQSLLDGDLKMVKLILEAGADPNVPDDGGGHALEWCTGEPELIELFLRYDINDLGLDAALFQHEIWVPDSPQNTAVRSKCIRLLRGAGAGRQPLAVSDLLTAAVIRGKMRYVYIERRPRTRMSSPIYVYILQSDLTFVRRGWTSGDNLDNVVWLVEALERGEDADEETNWHLGIMDGVGSQLNLTSPENIEVGSIRILKWDNETLPPESAFVPSGWRSTDWSGSVLIRKLKGVRVRIVSGPS